MKEKLLLAAKAAGYEVKEYGLILINRTTNDTGWRPNYSFEHAARLAFDCGMWINYRHGEVAIYDILGDSVIVATFIPNDTQSFCLAVVEAAAEMGRNK